METDPTKHEDNLLTFVKERLSTSPLKVFSSPRIFIENNHLANEMVCSMEAYFYSREREVQEVIIYPKRQRFWDYILRKKPQPQTVVIKCNDVIKNPPPENAPVFTVFETYIKPIMNKN